MAPPTDPLRQQAIEAVATALRAINGEPTYFFRVKSTSVVTDPGMGQNILTLPPTETPYFIVEPLPSGSKFYMPSMRVRHDFQVAITARADAPDRSLKMQTWERLIADIEVALTRDITLGGIAVDARCEESTPGFDLSQSPSVFVIQPVTINLIRTYGSPWNS